MSPLCTDAVAEPLAINGAAAATTFVINLPSPNRKSVALILPLTSIEPVNLEPISEPVNGVITLNPYSGLTDAVTEPDLISVLISASSVRAERGIFRR